MSSWGRHSLVLQSSSDPDVPMKCGTCSVMCTLSQPFQLRNVIVYYCAFKLGLKYLVYLNLVFDMPRSGQSWNTEIAG